MSRGGGRMRLEIALGHNTDSDTDKKPHLSPIDFGLSKCFFFEFFFHPACFRYVANSAILETVAQDELVVRVICCSGSTQWWIMLRNILIHHAHVGSRFPFFLVSILIARHVVNTLLLLS
jgi:hypothetical protein